MSEAYQTETGPTDTGQTAGWLHFLAGFFPIPPDTFTDLAKAGRHSVIFSHHRARLILSRAQLMAMLFAALTPLWIPLDVLVFPQPVWRSLILKTAVDRSHSSLSSDQ